MFWIALIVLHLVALGVLFRELTRGFYVKTRYNIQSISCSWILPTESGTSGCPPTRGTSLPLWQFLQQVSQLNVNSFDNLFQQYSL